MKKLISIAAACLCVSVGVCVQGAKPAVKPTNQPATQPAETPKSRTVRLLAESRKHESAGDYAKAARSARGALIAARAGSGEHVHEIRKRLRQIAARQGAVRRLGALSAVLKKKPDHLATRDKIIRICIVELDSPKRAAKFVNEDTDQVLQTYTPLAAGSIDKVSETGCQELAEWYLSYVKSASWVGRPAMLKRVAAYYGRFLKLHTAADDARAKAKEKFDSVVRQLGELGEEPDEEPDEEPGEKPGEQPGQ